MGIDVSKDFKEKLDLIIYPFMKIQIIFITAYSLFHWILIHELKIQTIREDIIEAYLPALIGGLIYYYFIRPKLKILNLKLLKRIAVLYHHYIAIVLIGPCLVFQQFIPLVNSELVEVNSLKDIYNYADTKFYKINDYFINIEDIRFKKDIDNSPRNGHEIEIYLVAPIYISQNLSEKNHVGWLAKKYDKFIRFSVSDQEERRMLEEHLIESRKQFRAIDFASFNYFERMGFTPERDNYLTATNSNSEYLPSRIIFTEVYSDFKDRYNNIIIAFLLVTLLLYFGFIILIR
jgi:hypothetical protein